MDKSTKNILSIIVGIMSALVVIYRITILMMPMIITGIKTNNIPEIFKALSLLV